MLYKNTFPAEHLQMMTGSEFLQNGIDKFKDVRQTKVQKRFIYREKKESMEQRETKKHVTKSRAVARKSWMVRCSPLAWGF